MRRLSRIPVFLVLILAAAPLAGQTPAPSSDSAAAEPASPALTPDAIIDSWNARRRAIDAFECEAYVQDECRVYESTKMNDPFADPFKGSGKAHIVALRYELTLKRRNEVMAAKKFGDALQQDPLHPTTLRTLAFCDLEERRTLHTSEAFPITNMGTIWRGDMKGNSLAAYEDAVPVWLWYDPASILPAYGCEGSQGALVGDGPRMKFVFQGRALSPRQKAPHVEFEIGLASPHVVHRVTWKRGDATIVDCQLVYSEANSLNDEIGPALKSWTYRRFGEGTAWETRRQGYVSKLVGPAKLTNDDFTFEFPVGTHIAESKGSKSFIHWLQTSPTERRRLTPGEYGRAEVTR